MKCPKCNGAGTKKVEAVSYTLPCTFCWGIEDLDWIEYIFGIPLKEILYGNRRNKK
jgi:hypothetical protein